MSKYVIDSSTLTSIADAVRTKGGTTEPIVVSDIPTAITNLPSGGGGISEEDLTFTAHGEMYLFNQDYNKIYEKNTSRIKIVPATDSGKKIYDLGRLCHGSTIKDLSPITIDCSGVDIFCCSYAFNKCEKLEKLPKIINSQNTKLGSSIIFANMNYYLREDEILKFLNCFDSFTDRYTISGSISNLYIMFDRYYGVIDTSSIFSRIHYMMNNNVNSQLTSPDFNFRKPFPYTKAIENFPIPYSSDYNFDITSNRFSGYEDVPFSKSLTFATDNGQPYQINMKSQVIDLTNYPFGYNSYNYYTDYSKGANYWKVENNIFTSDRMTIEQAQERYNLLKNQEDWYSCSNNQVSYNGKTEYIAKLFARYNHDSAVATINSLPDTSAYLATAGGTNTIEFYGVQGALTDGGAINTLTEEEIAVAAAKGWTVTLV